MKTQKGFTLIELLVVISIIALLLSILMPGLQMAKENAKRLICTTNLKNIGTALHSYSNSNDDKAIPLFTYKGGNLAETYDLEKDNVLPWYGYIVGLDLDGTYLEAVGMGKLFSSGEVDIPDIFYCPTAEKTLKSESNNQSIEFYTTNIDKSMPKGAGVWGSNVDETSGTPKCRSNYMYWTWEENTYANMSLRPVVVDRLTSWTRVAHQKNGEPYGLNGLFGDGHVNTTRLTGNKKLEDVIRGANWDDLAKQRDNFLAAMRWMRP